MLKIKDNVDLKELEKYGFKPLYNKHTGELNEMYYSCKISSDRKISVKKTSLKNYEHKIFRFWRRNNYQDKSGYYLFAFLDKGYVEEYANVLYDLIKDGLVEKVEE